MIQLLLLQKRCLHIIQCPSSSFCYDSMCFLTRTSWPQCSQNSPGGGCSISRVYLYPYYKKFTKGFTAQLLLDLVRHSFKLTSIFQFQWPKEKILMRAVNLQPLWHKAKASGQVFPHDSSFRMPLQRESFCALRVHALGMESYGLP